MKQAVLSVTLITAILFSVSAMAQTKVVVVPLGSKKTDPNLLADNIKCGTTIFGVTGAYTGIPSTVCSAGRIWMDRNLGASQVATGSADTLAYGDLYQWGRLTDGHEDRLSSTTTILSTTDDPGNSTFILVSSSPWDWRMTKNDNLWQGVAGINNPCPTGFRLPTEAEWDIERTSWSSDNGDGAFGSPLKLCEAGARHAIENTISTGVGIYRSSTVEGIYGRGLSFNSTGAYMYSYTRAVGISVRCIKN